MPGGGLYRQALSGQGFEMSQGQTDMTAIMKHLLTSLAVTLVVAIGTAAASAQIVPQVSNPVPVPQPPPPPPSLAVPQVPKMDAPPAPAPGPRPERRSFNQRVQDCQTDTTASRLDSGDRAAYSRACANQL